MSPEYPFMGSFNQTGFAPYLEDGSITTQFPENVTNSESTAPQNAPDEYGLSHSHYLDLSAYNETTTIIVDSDRRDGVSPSSGYVFFMPLLNRYICDKHCKIMNKSIKNLNNLTKVAIFGIVFYRNNFSYTENNVFTSPLFLKIW